ncbi:MAG TPA: DoxX family protein [Flavitalea sp.]|nr:DoxX family protein [Flavitalea sp.]
MNIALWIIQVILAFLFGLAGVTKSGQPIDKLANKMTWVNRFSVPVVRFVGVVELMAAIGLILPWALNILPVLTPLSAAGIALIMVLAAIHHLKFQEGKAIVFNLVLLLMAAFVAYGRLIMSA